MEEKDPKKEELDFIYDDDIVPVLEKLGIKNSFVNGEVQCNFCDDIVTLENLHSFFFDGGRVKMVCSGERCVKQLKIKE